MGFKVRTVPQGMLPKGVAGIMVGTDPDGTFDPKQSKVILWKRIRPVSKSRAPELREYRKRKAVFLLERRNWVCPVAAHFGYKDKVIEVHHLRGRVGKLLNDERYWLGVSVKGHRRIHDNPVEAQRHGWLARLGDWGKAD
jgi:hypothetical protein